MARSFCFLIYQLLRGVYWYLLLLLTFDNCFFYSSPILLCIFDAMLLFTYEFGITIFTTWIIFYCLVETSLFQCLYVSHFLLFLIFYCSFIFIFYVSLYILVVWLVKSIRIQFTIYNLSFNWQIYSLCIILIINLFWYTSTILLCAICATLHFFVIYKRCTFLIF